MKKEYERYEFGTEINNFVDLGDDWAILHFSFLSKRYMMFVTCNNQSEFDKISPVMENIFNAIGVEPLLEEEFSRDIT